MDLDELRALLAVVESGSFLAAAEALGAPRTTLRRRVAALEARAGQIVVERGKSMLDEASALFATVREAGREPSGTLRLVMPVGLPPSVVRFVFAAARAKWPDLLLHMQPSRSPLTESLLDVDLVAHFDRVPPKGDWVSHVVAKVDESLVATAAYLERKGRPQHVDDLEGHELFVWESPDEDPLSLPLRAGGEVPIEPELVTSDVHLIHQCCLAELGIGFVPNGHFHDPAFPGVQCEPVLGELIGRTRALRLSIPSAACRLPKMKVILAALPVLVPQGGGDER